jgi:hypothetical protein
MNRISCPRVVVPVIVMSLLGGLLLVGGCGPRKQAVGVRLPDAPRLVGGGLMIGWKAPQPGTVYLVEQQTNKLVETRSLDEGEVYSFAATSVIQADEFEQMLGIKFSKARFALFFEPQDGAGEPAVAKQSLWAGSRF